MIGIAATLRVTSVDRVTEERLRRDIWDLTDGMDEPVPIWVNATSTTHFGSESIRTVFFGAQVVVFVTFDPNALDLPLIPLSEAPRIDFYGNSSFGNVELGTAKVANWSIQSRVYVEDFATEERPKMV